MWGFNGNCKAGFSSWLSWSQVAKPKIEQRQRWPPWDVPSRLVRRLWRRWCVWRKMYTGIRNGLGVAIKISGEDKQKGIPTVLLVTLDIKCCWFWYIYIFFFIFWNDKLFCLGACFCWCWKGGLAGWVHSQEGRHGWWKKSETPLNAMKPSKTLWKNGIFSIYLLVGRSSSSSLLSWRGNGNSLLAWLTGWY